MQKSTIRLWLGILVSPVLVALGWSAPEWGYDSFMPALRFNVMVAFPIAAIFFCACHFTLKSLRLAKIWHYCVLMFLVSAGASAGANNYGLHVYTDFTEGRTVLVKSGELTSAGRNSIFKKALLNGIYCSTGMFIFLAIRGRKPPSAQEPVDSLDVK